MNKFFTILICLLSLSALAQNDSVSLSAGATKMVFFNLTTHTKYTAANDDWHLAFSARYISGFTHTTQATTIRINEAYGLKLYRNPSQKLAQWASFDTTGWQHWQQMHNPDTTWDIGAFNVNKNFNDQYNYGWGEYNFGNHNIISDSSLYLIQLPDGSFKKFAILNLLYDTAFNVQYANLDGSSFSPLEVRKNPYNSKNFVYLNLNNTTIMDKEPALSSWDLQFFRYNNTAYNAADLSQDIGILTRDGVQAYAASGATAMQACYSGSYSSYINAIGKSWMGQSGDTLTPGLAYFVQTPAGSYKYTVTGFEGAASGILDFNIGICAQTGIDDVASELNTKLYPIPAIDIIHVDIYDTQAETIQIQVMDITGRIIHSQNESARAGQNTYQINTSMLQSGNYIVALSTSASKTSKLISVIK